MNGKKAMMIAIVAVIVVLLGYILPMVFSFEGKESKNKGLQQIDDRYINVLYSYLPEDNYYKTYNNYNEYYTEKNNLSKQVLMTMVYNYIVTSDRFKLLTLDESEQSTGALYKISLIDMKKAYNTVFYVDDFQAVDFEYNNIKGVVKDEYMYIYNNDKTEEYVNYKNIDSYALANNGDEIIIYDYYIKCSKTDNVCYNDGNMTVANNRINDINNINEKFLVKYKHKFKFDNYSYYWFSSEAVVD